MVAVLLILVGGGLVMIMTIIVHIEVGGDVGASLEEVVAILRVKKAIM